MGFRRKAENGKFRGEKNVKPDWEDVKSQSKGSGLLL